ncbi:MAG: hypothetical protein ACI8WB_002260, partial [Phenylobacterium sp.]
HVNSVTDFISPEVIDEIPGSLRDSLQQKLDSLVCAKETAQLAATIGREFDDKLLMGASDHAQAQVQSDLEELIEAELIYLQRQVGGDRYIFKHALVRDAAYESMVKPRQKLFHGWIGQALEHADVVNQQPAIVAYHFEYAEDFVAATKYSHLHADQLVEKASFNDAQSQFKKALLLYHSGGITDTELEVSLRNGLASSIIAGEGWLKAEAVSLLKQNQRLTEHHKHHNFTASRGAWLVHWASGEVNEAHVISTALYQHHHQHGPDNKMIIYEMIIQTSFTLSQFDAVRQYYNECLDTIEHFDNLSATTVESFGMVSSIACQVFMSIAALIEGNIGDAYRVKGMVDAALTRVKSDGYLSGANGLMAWFYIVHWHQETGQQQREALFQQALEHIHLGIDLGIKSDNDMWVEYNKMYLSMLTFEVDGDVVLSDFEAKIKRFDAYKLNRGFAYLTLSRRARDANNLRLAEQTDDICKQEIQDSGITFVTSLFIPQPLKG